MWILIVTSCKKDKGLTADVNKTPVARAGSDTSIFLPSCNTKTGSITLNGNNSSDPDNNITEYSWAKISGPAGIVIRDPASPQTLVVGISSGLYAFELKVQDEFGKISMDTVNFNIFSAGEEYDLNITVTTDYNFTENYFDYYGYEYYDVTVMQGSVTHQPFGLLQLNIQEYGDSAALSDVHETYLYLSQLFAPNVSIGGTSTVNFKKLARDGGGVFNGTFSAQFGSAEACGVVIRDLQPLNVSGSLNLNTNSASITIKGKVFF